jgi:glycosyltransferase involved in cell wall biosynthesis
MCEPWYGDKVLSWPVGIDTDAWNPSLKNEKRDFNFLIYDKIRWEREIYEDTLLNPIKEKLQNDSYTYDYLRYGNYKQSDLIEKLKNTDAVIFLCEHETQGIAYQQILSTGTPIFAWDRGGFWTDPHYYPERVQYGPVTSVPYWDIRCGMKFKDFARFSDDLQLFMMSLDSYNPRDFMLENLTLELSATQYLNIIKQVDVE